ncbi:MAG: TIGR04086 family membrane protein [Clostridia bacterium]|nr:TIGR04086 family membrane protein [Clostridia bacterium]
MKGKLDVKPLIRILKGVMIASLATVIGMLLLTGWVVVRGLDEKAILIVNQLIKVISVLAGVFFSVGRGGEKGLLTGAAVGILYILIGYGMYSIIDGSGASAAVMAIEETAGALIGASAGVVLANMKAGRRTRAYR